MSHEPKGNRGQVRIVGFAFCAVIFGMCFPVEAQQAKRVPRIGFVNTEGSPQAPGPQFEASVRDCGTSVISRVEISSLTFATLRKTQSALRDL
jgi:hypothetical protein